MIKSIRMNYVDPTVVLTNSMGMVQAGAASNVIPQTLTFGGTCRFYDADAGNVFKQKLVRIVKTQAELFDMEVAFDRLTGPILPVINNEALANVGADAIRAAMGPDAVQPKALNMGSESFAVLTKYYPGVMMRVGVGNEEEGMTVGGHNPGFDLDENGLPYGAALAGLTINPARIWGFADKAGSLEPGKDADLVIWSGDPLETTSWPTAVFVAGQEQPMTSRGLELRDRYKVRGGAYPPAYN